MLAGRVTIGITEGPQFGTAISVVKRWFPLREQALGNAVWTIGSPLGSMIGFPLVIFLVAQYGWRASFYVLAALMQAEQRRGELLRYTQWVDADLSSSVTFASAVYR